MNGRFATFFSFIFESGVIILTFFTPLLFWNLTTEYFETPKFLLLTILVGIFLLAWAVKYVISGKGKFYRTLFDLPLALLLLVFIVSTFFAASKSVAIFGQLPRIHGGLASFILYIGLYFILVSNLSGAKIIKRLVYCLTLSGTVLSILSLLAYFGKSILPFSWTTTINFTPTGSSFSTTAILALLLPFPLIALMQDSEEKIISSLPSLKNLLTGIVTKKTFDKLILTTVLILFISTIILTGSASTYIASGASLLLSLFIVSPAKIKRNILWIAVPIILAILLIIFSSISTGGSKNILYNQARMFPRELQLPLESSWKISISTFRDFPFWGSGPASYLTDFTTYKTADFNNQKIWNIRFDQAFNEYLQILATLGSLGLIAILLFTTIYISSATRVLTSSKGSLETSLAISGITFFIIMAFHTLTLPVWVIGIIILSTLMVIQRKNDNETQTKASLSLNFDTLPIIVLIITLIVLGGLFYFTGKYALADYYHRLALDNVNSGKVVDAYRSLLKAENLNPNIDLYRIDLAQTNFALANAIATTKGPTQASPSGNLTDKDKQDIQSFLQQAISEGRAATILNPNNSANWEVLGSIYRQISGVAQNALAFAIDAYGQAIKHDPVNPTLRLSVGGIYYSVKNYDLAIRFFTDAINLKPDYANGYYNLALAMKEKGDFPPAISFAEKTISLLEVNSADYKKAVELLSDLRSQQANSSAPLANEVPQSALQNKNLPKVLNLPKPEKISTPSAVKKQPTPTP